MTKSKKMTIFVLLAHKKGIKMQENNPLPGQRTVFVLFLPISKQMSKLHKI